MLSGTPYQKGSKSARQWLNRATKGPPFLHAFFIQRFHYPSLALSFLLRDSSTRGLPLNKSFLQGLPNVHYR